MAPVLLLDGGMGHFLKQSGLSLPDLPIEQQFLAGVLASEAAPDIVVAAHRAFASSGCCILTTSNYAATKHALARIGREDDVAALTQVQHVL
jgi:methionine synthase I (cobalamin-dependent)